MEKLANIINKSIKVITFILAAFFAIYGILMLRDTYCIQQEAFSSYDLLQYRPNIEENKPPYLDDLININEDTVGWITIYNTNMDYPIMQGKDDLTYINKDVYGNFSISGSIFLSYQNSKDFSDPYNLVYGHHMDNGAMFGDVLKNKEKDFFNKNNKGILFLPNKVYDLTVMAVLETDAYDHNIYYINNNFDYTINYIKNNSLYYKDIEYEHIVALSTCDDATTSGRTILICAMNTRTDPLPAREDGEAVVHREPIGHPMAGAYWALLNLIILLCILYYGILTIIYNKKNIKYIIL